MERKLSDVIRELHADFRRDYHLNYNSVQITKWMLDELELLTVDAIEKWEREHG